MSSPWVNKYAIMRDLSLVQGAVPVDVAGTVSAGDRPPSQDIVEETEEEFYRNCTGGDGDYEEPDLHLIKHMLDLVQSYDVQPDVEVEPESEKVIEISKVEPPQSEIIQPKINADKTGKENKPKRKQRNAAMASLLLNLENEENAIKTSNVEPMKLLKPADFNTTAIEKVNGWFKTQEKIQAWAKPRNTKLTLDVDPATMFKKKDFPPLSKVEKEVVISKKPSVRDIAISKKPCVADLNNNSVSMFKNKDFPTLPKMEKEVVISKRSNVPSIKSELILDPASMFKKKNSPSPPKQKAIVESNKPKVYTEFVPSSNAAEYYKTFLENSKMKEMLTEDVWARAERQMREIDERRKQEAELFAISLALSKSKESTSSPATSTDIDDPRLDVVRLPQYRHTLKGKCIVCAVMTKNDPKAEHSNDKACLCSSDDDDDDDDMESWRSRAEGTVIENWRLEKIHDENIDSWIQSDIDTIDSELD